MKTLSIVIPTYNVEKYLAKCLNSLTYAKEVLDDIELIVVNDGSKDHSLEIAKRYEKEFPKTIKVIDKENGGHGSTINVGLKIAEGKYFRVIDSDDWVNIDEFKDYVKDLKKLDTDIVLTNYSQELIYSGEKELFTYLNLEYDKVYDLNKFDYNLLEEKYFFMATSTFKTDKLRKSGVWLDEKTFYVDSEFIILPYLEMNSMIYLNYDIYRYFIGRADQSVNVQNYVRHKADHEKVTRRVLEYYKSIPNEEPKKEYIHRIILQLLNTHYIIFCKAKLDNKKDLELIKVFDKDLKENHPEIYQELRNKHKYIKWNQNTHFVFSQSCHNIFSRFCDRLDRKRRG